jgi:glycosyltransferase involved in cell wall biosynthesis
VVEMKGEASIGGITKTEAAHVLHIPFTYFPDAVGGTEIYVDSLAHALREKGINSAVAAPGQAEGLYSYNGTDVFRFKTAARSTTAHAYGVPDREAAESFQKILAQLQPQIVHLHGRTAAVSNCLVDAAHQVGARTVLTYHTPTVSCMRGTMMHLGRESCDGRLDVRRCTRCVLQARGLPGVVSTFLAATPCAVGDALGRVGLQVPPLTPFSMSALVRGGHQSFQSLVGKVDRVVAVCGWVAEVLKINGVPKEKIVLCRQGLPHLPHYFSTISAPPKRDHALRIVYFGRLDPTKGVDLLIAAVRSQPGAKVALDIYGVGQPGSETYVSQIAHMADPDPRIVIHPAVRSEDVIEVMRNYDVVVVPSRWLETGPLVVLESFAAGTPVLGARLGGIAELVRDGVDGLLVSPDDVQAWAGAIVHLANRPDLVSRLRSRVRSPRTVRDVATDMAGLYRDLLRPRKYI